MKILSAIDGSANSDEAVKEVARRPWPAESEVRVISAIEPLYAPATEPWSLTPDYYTEVEKTGRERAMTAIENALLTLRESEDKTLKLSSETIVGSPKQVVLDETERWGADLIVVGSHGYGAWDRFLLGSVSQAVALHAKCSVEIIRVRR